MPCSYSQNSRRSRVDLVFHTCQAEAHLQAHQRQGRGGQDTCACEGFRRTHTPRTFEISEALVLISCNQRKRCGERLPLQGACLGRTANHPQAPEHECNRCRRAGGAGSRPCSNRRSRFRRERSRNARNTGVGHYRRYRTDRNGTHRRSIVLPAARALFNEQRAPITNLAGAAADTRVLAPALRETSPECGVVAGHFSRESSRIWVLAPLRR